MTKHSASKGNSYIQNFSGVLIAFLLLIATAMEPSARAASPPAQPSLNTPGEDEEMQNSDALQFSWEESSQAATWFYLWISRNGAKHSDQWIGGTNVWNPPDFPGGNYTWWVRPWGPGGYGPWSGAGHFTIYTNVPGPINLVGPLGPNENNPNLSYTWQADPGASWYRLYVDCNGKCFKDQWYYETNLAVTEKGDLSVPLGGHRKGAYRWWVQAWGIDGMGAWSSAGQFTVPAQTPGTVMPLTPADDQAVSNNPPVLAWSGCQPSASWYCLTLSCNNTQYSTTWLQNETWTPNNALPVGDYTWKVRTWNSEGYGSWCEDAHFKVASGESAPGAVTPLTPADGAAVSNSQPPFSWSPPQPAATWYSLILNSGGAQYCSVWLQSETWTPTNGLPPGDYTWQVRGWNSMGYGEWCNTCHFTVLPSGSVPGTVTPLTPAEAEIVSTNRPLLTWSAAQPAASGYSLVLSSGGTPLYSVWLEERSWTPTNALPAGDYTWQVRGWNSTGWGAWCSGTHFTVPTETVGPGPVDQMFPEYTIYSGTNLIYQFGLALNATRYELQVTRNGQPFIDQWLEVTNLTYVGTTRYSIKMGGHSPGNYYWRVRAWSPDTGMGPWSAGLPFTIHSAPEPLAVAGSQWLGIFRTYQSVSNAYVYHVIWFLNFNSDGTYSGDGLADRLVLEPYSDDVVHEDYTGTYTVNGNVVQGTSTNGHETFSLTLDSTLTQALSGTWSDIPEGTTCHLYPAEFFRAAPPGTF